tara:strand:- start:245 stop:2233 length:1989 start_codon:yes stop_codon:yes gene_type:complete
MRGVLILFFCLLQTMLFAQISRIPTKGSSTGIIQQDNNSDPLNAREVSSTNIKKFERPPVEDYKIISIARDTTHVDTTLNIKKDYKFNYLRKDRYGLLPFANTGQTNNTLIYDFNNRRTTPGYIAQARHFAYMEVEDINYYHLPTPLTELFYRSAFEQGQQLDAFFTLNIHPRLNMSIAYKGVRSLGKYQNALTSSGNFRFASSYRTKNDRYHIRGHWVAQDLLNQENGGLTEQGIEQFNSGEGDFSDRSRLPVNFEDAESILDGTRIYVNHHYNLVQKKDSLKDYSLRVGHIFNSENKFYTYRQDAANAIFGEAFSQTSFSDRTDHEETYNEINAVYEDKKLGQLKFQANALYYDYGYNAVLIQDADGDGVSERVPNRLQGTNIAVGGAYKNRIGGFDIEGEAQVNVVGDFDGYNIYGEAGYSIADDKRFSVSILSNARQASFNHLLFQSNYLNYNWSNQDNYATVKTNTLAAQLDAKSLVNLEASASTIKDFAYFGLGEDGLVTSLQSGEAVNHLKISANRDIKLGKFNLDLTATYQNVTGAEGVLNVPDVVGRGSFYFTDRLFKKALFLQTGITANYFTKYNLNGYDPILAEFYVQNTEELGNFPLLDFFINMKVRQTRIFIKAEHFNSSFTGSDFYSAPGYPYRDFNIRFGIVWNFFL